MPLPSRNCSGPRPHLTPTQSRLSKSREGQLRGPGGDTMRTGDGLARVVRTRDRRFVDRRSDGLPGWPLSRARLVVRPNKDRGGRATWSALRGADSISPVRTGRPRDDGARPRERGPVRSWRAGTAGSRPTRSSWHRARISGPGSPAFAAELDPGTRAAAFQRVPGSIPAAGRAASSSSAPPTRGPRSPWRCPGAAGPGCRGGTRATNPPAPEAGGIGYSCR